MKKIFAVLATALLALGLTLSSAVSAQAAEVPQASAQNYTCGANGASVRGSLTLLGNPHLTWQVAFSTAYGGHAAGAAFNAAANTYYTDWGGSDYEGSVTVTAHAETGFEFDDYDAALGGDSYTLNLEKTVAMWVFAFQKPDCSPSVTFDVTHTCGALTIEVTAANLPANRDWYYGLTAIDSGSVALGSVVQKNNGTSSSTITFAEDAYGGSADVKVYVHAATEWDYVPVALNYHSTYPLFEDHFIAATVNTNCIAVVAGGPGAGPAGGPGAGAGSGAAADPGAGARGGATLASTGIDATRYVVVGSLFLGSGVLAVLLGAAYRRTFATKP